MSNQKKTTQPSNRGQAAHLNPRIFVVVFLCIFIYLLGSLLYRQTNAADYELRARKFWTKNSKIYANRGRIFDNSEHVLARTATSQTVVVRPEALKTKVERERVAQILSQILELKYADVLAKVSNEKLVQVHIKRQVSEEQLFKISMEYLNGVEFLTEPTRYYSQNNLAAQLIGFTNFDGQGQTGLEKEFETYLAGKDGLMISLPDAKGESISFQESYREEAQDGNDLVLTIDMISQASLDEALQELVQSSEAVSAQGVILDIRSGKVLALSNQPDFDLNQPPREDNKTLANFSRNRVLMDTYHPTEFIQTLTTAIALEEKIASPESKFTCAGAIDVDDQIIACPIEHGEQTLEQAMQNNCKVVFAQLGLKIGKDRFYQYMERLGLDNMPIPEMKNQSVGKVLHKKYASAGSIAKMASGGDMKLTMMQVASLYASILNQDKRIQPYIIEEIRAQGDGTILQKTNATQLAEVFSIETSQAIAQMLRMNLEKRFQNLALIPGYAVGGRSASTIEVIEPLQENSFRNSFLIFSPAEKPRFLVMVSVFQPRVHKKDFNELITAPTVRRIMRDVLQYHSIKPEDSSLQSDSQAYTAVPETRGMTHFEAKQALNQVGLLPLANGEGIVINQSCGFGTMAPKGSVVLLYMTDVHEDVLGSNGKIAVPDLHGLTVYQAYARLSAVGLQMTISGDPMTKISSQSPRSGEYVQRNRVISVRCSNFEPGVLETATNTPTP